MEAKTFWVEAKEDFQEDYTEAREHWLTVIGDRMEAR